MAENYYEILGISKNATDAEIKKAYKKKAVKYHPDRPNGSEEKFKKINEANEVLSDPDKRSYYDRMGTMEGYGQGGADGFDFGFGDFFSMFNGGRNSRFNNSNHVVNGDNIRSEIPITFEELYNGCTKELIFKRKVRCSKCHGIGGENEQECPNCHGTGQHVHVERTPFGISQQITSCPNCHGTGKIIKNKCTKCNGTGFEYETEKMSITLSTIELLKNNFYKKYIGKGSESKDKRGLNGNLEVIFSLRYDKSKYLFNGYNIMERVNVNWYDALLGMDYKLTLPNGDIKTVRIPSCTKENTNIKVGHYGFANDGDYYINVHIVFPDKLSDFEKEKIKEIKENN